MCLMVVFAASVRALVTPVAMVTSMAGHQAVLVAANQSVSSVSAIAAQASNRVLASQACSMVGLARISHVLTRALAAVAQRASAHSR